MARAPRYLPPRPALILIMGVAGSGKSTLARRIISRVAAVYLDNNQIVDAFFPNTRNGAAYARLRPAFYKALYRITGENLTFGNSVVLDVPHIREAQTVRWRTYIRELARANSAELIVIHCTCGEDALRDRLAARGEPRDRWKLRNWRTFLSDQPTHADIAFPHLTLDTTQSLSRNANQAVRYIMEHTGPGAKATVSGRSGVR